MEHTTNTNIHPLVLALCILLNTISLDPVYAQKAEISESYIEQLLDQVSNWGRWGAGDEMGTINFISNDTRVEAARLVTAGESISLSLDLDKQKAPLNPNPMQHELELVNFAGDTWAVDTYTMHYHGYSYSHIDALCHLLYQDKMYNGFSGNLITARGSEKLGIQNMSKGILTRGIIIDVPRLKGVNYLEPGDYIMPGDLESWEASTGLKVGKGDVLLIRTGWRVKESEDGPWNYTELAAGLHPSVVPWLHEREVAVLGSDGASERYPSGLQRSQSPIHFLVIYGMGMPILDNLDLEQLAEYAAEQERYEFMFTAAPLRVNGGTGSPLNPIATF